MNDQFTCSANWLKESSVEETINFLIRFALEHASKSGPYREMLETLVSSRDWDGLVNFDLDYGRGSTIELLNARQCLGFFQKLKDLPLGLDLEKVAFDKFVDAERNCLATNQRLRKARTGDILPPARVASVLLTAQRKISSILGDDVPSLDALHFAFGPGANTSVKATASSPRWKLSAQLECSAELAPCLGALQTQFPHWFYEHRTRNTGTLGALEDHLERWMVPVHVVPGKLSFVDKNAKTKRSIVVEPILNAVAQKGVGTYIKGRLRSVGLDLRTQAETNKRLAQRASIDKSLATIDLSAASDTISYEVVADLLPLDWFLFLRNFRTGRIVYGEDEIQLQKFSSMGNGFTFELETLLFWSIAHSVCCVEGIDASEVSCFGDDIILPTAACDLLFVTLEYLGFSINRSKSFWTGDFRESCGGDYVCGFDIRPFYQKDLVSGRTLFLLHNFYMRHFEFEMASMVVDAIPEALRIYGPDGYGDGHLIGTWLSTARLKTPWKKMGYGGVVFDTFTEGKLRLNDKLIPGDRVLPFYSIYAGEREEIQLDYLDDSNQATDHFIVRGSSGYQRHSIYTLSTGVYLR